MGSSAATRILVIDDSEDLRESLRMVLESAGHQVEVANDGVEGLERTRSFHPDLIITDISMPRMNGFDFLVRLRSDFKAPLPPVVVCSGFDTTAGEALRLGATRFVAKPFDTSALMTAVNQTLKGQLADEATLAREREYVQAARAKAADAAAELLRGIDVQAPANVRLAGRFIQWVSDYFGFGPAALLLVENGDVRVTAASRGCVIPEGQLLSGRMLYSTGVLASGTSLVLADARPFAQVIGDPRAESLGIGFLVAVPLMHDQTPVGALCLVDRESHPFEAEDLVILEGIGRSLSQAIQRGPTGENIGLAPPTLFDRMLNAELGLLHRARGVVDLLLVDLDPRALRSELALELVARGGARLGVCRRDVGRLAVFKRDTDRNAAKYAVSAVLSAISAAGAVQAASWVSLVDNGLPAVPSGVLLQLAQLALDESRGAPTRRVERIVIGGEELAAVRPSA